MNTVLGLYNTQIENPYSYCSKKKCFLTSDQYDSKQCDTKNCHHAHIIQDGEDISKFQTELYDYTQYWDYCYTNKSQIDRVEKYEKSQRKKSYSTVKVLKEKLKNRMTQPWMQDLDFYYQNKYEY